MGYLYNIEVPDDAEVIECKSESALQGVFIKELVKHSGIPIIFLMTFLIGLTILTGLLILKIHLYLKKKNHM